MGKIQSKLKFYQFKCAQNIIKEKFQFTKHRHSKMCVQFHYFFLFRLTSFSFDRRHDHWSTSPTSVAHIFDFIYYIDDVENVRQISLPTCFWIFEKCFFFFVSSSFVCHKQTMNLPWGSNAKCTVLYLINVKSLSFFLTFFSRRQNTL